MRKYLFMILALLLAGQPERVGAEEQTAASGELVEPGAVADPLEGWNRFWFEFNDRLYYWALKPVATGYQAVVPEGGRVAVSNFFHNLSMPVRAVNSLLQGKAETSFIEVNRFLLNTTLGAGGFFDVAEINFALPGPDSEDLGQTLGTYGVDSGIYLVWPLLGPSNLRDTIGEVGDHFLKPTSYYPEEFWTRQAIYGYKVVNELSLRMGEYEDIKEGALDPYISLRDAYEQNRASKIAK